MFKQDFCWEMNGSSHQVPTVSSKSSAQADISVRRQLNPVRPVMAHECVHYIDIPDYAKLNRKFDAFAKTVGAEALARNGIEKPRYMTDLPALIGLKKLENKMPDYIEASQQFKTMALKTYLEQLRMSPKLCGFEMLQLSDCLKYENNNGIIDCFDDDKFIPAEWMRQFNSDLVLLAEFPKENFRENESFQMSIHLSNFSNALLYDGQLTLSLKVANGFQEILYEGSHFSALSGLSKLLDLQLALKAIGSQACECTLEAVFSSPGGECRNQWKLWVYPAVRLNQCPETRLSQPELKVVVQKLGKDVLINKNLILSDRLDDTLLDMLDAGKTVILNYHRDLQNQYYLPGTLDRFKPCIWDRGSNLGGVVTADWLQTALGSGRNFDKNLYHLVEMAYKVNLDHFPCSVNEVVWGVDKPVRDRMKGLIHGTKTFLPDDTLRNFSYLFSVRVGRGLLMVCTFKLEAALTDPAAESVLCAIINSASYLKTDHRLEPAVFKKYLQDCTAAGVIKEDVMNHFWEIDNKPVEDTLFWEQAQVDLRKMGSATNK